METKINYNTFGTKHSRDYYRGASFHYSGQWVVGAHYLSDDYNVDFIVNERVLLACSKSHLSTLENEPINFIRDDNGNVIGIISEYWDFVLAGMNGSSPGIRINPENYHWEICDNTNLTEEQQVWVDTGVKSKFEFSDLTEEEKQELIQPALDADVFISGDGINSAILKGSNGTAFGDNSVVEGISVTSAIERGITSASTNDEIITEWSGSTPDTDKFSLAKGEGSHVEGNNGLALGNHSHVEGNGCVAGNNSAHAEGTGSRAEGKYSHAEGLETRSLGQQSHAEGKQTGASASCSHAEGQNTLANKAASHSEGINTVAGSGSKPTADSDTTAGKYSHAEGNGTFASGNSSHAEGKSTEASGAYSHSEGLNTIASGPSAHAEGELNEAAEDCSHAEGYNNKVYIGAGSSHVEGSGTEVRNSREHAQGSYNVSHTLQNHGFNGSSEKTLHSVGMGTSDNNRKNAFEIMQNGDVYIIGLGGYDGTNAAQSGVKTLQQLLIDAGIS